MNRTAPCGRRASCYVPVRLALRPPPEQPIAIGRTRHRHQARVGTLLGDEPVPIDVLYDTDRAQRLARLQQMPLFGRRPMCREDYRQADGTEPAGLNTPPATVTIVVQDIPAAGTYTLSVWYENNAANDGLTEPRDMSLLVNGQFDGPLNFAVTNSWYETNSKVTTTTVQVPSGSSTFAIACHADDSCHINVWEIELK